MKAKTKENLGNIFGGLFKNQRVINGAKHNAWWVALIMFVVGVILPVIPLTVSAVNAYGAQFISGNVYGLESQITEACLGAYLQGYEFEVTSYNNLEGTLNGAPITTREVDPVYQVISEAGDHKNEITFQLYYSSRNYSGESSIKDYVKNLSEKRYISGSSVETSTIVDATESADSETKETYYRPSFLVLFKGGIYAYLATPGTYTAAAEQSGDWKNTEVGTEILSRVLLSQDEKLPPLPSAGNFEAEYEATMNTYLRQNAYIDDVFENWEDLFNEIYLFTKENSILYQTFFFLGIYAIIVLFMGLMIFLLTRGKKNTFNYLTFWQCEKISMWASVSPGLLSLILGFLMSSYAVMFFIILMGLRIMWICMKQLRPQYN